MLETYDPKVPEKHEAYAREFRATSTKRGQTMADLARCKALAAAMCDACDAELKTPNQYIRRHLSFTLKEADELGIWGWLPTLPDDAGIDATQAAVRQVATYVDAVKRRRETLAVCARAGVEPQIIPKIPHVTWRTRWAMLRFRLGRAGRLRKAQK